MILLLCSELNSTRKHFSTKTGGKLMVVAGNMCDVRLYVCNVTFIAAHTCGCQEPEKTVREPITASEN